MRLLDIGQRVFPLSKIAVLSTTVSLSPEAQAQNVQTVRIEHSLRASVWAPGGVRFTGNDFFVGPDSYEVSAINSGGFARPATRPFFVFELPSREDLPGEIVGATLRLFHPSTSFANNFDESETISFHAVSTSTAALRALRSPPIDPATGARRDPTPRELGLLGAIFEDLGDGKVFGSMESSASNQGQFQETRLNLAALNSLKAARVFGREWAIGGELSSLNLTNQQHPVRSTEHIFRDSDSLAEGIARPATELVLRIRERKASPAPALGGVFGLALLGLGLYGVGQRPRLRSKSVASVAT